MWFIGGFLYHLLFETKGVYVYPYATILIPLATIGLDEISVQVKKIKRFKHSKRNLLIGVMFIFALSIVINRQKFVLPVYESYADVPETIILENNKVYVTQKIVPKSDIKISGINLEYSGELGNNILYFEISNKNESILYGSVMQKDLSENKGWLQKDFDEVLIKGNEEYEFTFYVKGDENKDFSLIYGYNSWNVGDLIINSEKLDDNVINLKLLEKEYSIWWYYQNNKIDYLNNMYYKLW